jgi:osmoprotectant transport system permease protein
MGSYLRYLSENSTELIFYAQQHFLLVFYSVGLASVISLVLAVVVHTNQLTPASWRRSVRSAVARCRCCWPRPR